MINNLNYTEIKLVVGLFGSAVCDCYPLNAKPTRHGLTKGECVIYCCSPPVDNTRLPGWCWQGDGGHSGELCSIYGLKGIIGTGMGRISSSA